MANDRLKNQIIAAGLSIEDVAAHIQLDPKSIGRWISRDRIPHQRHRWAAAALLKCDETYLWPSLLEDEGVTKASQSEFVALYPSRSVVPPDLWPKLVSECTEAMDILVYAGLFLVDAHIDFAELVEHRATAGCKVRILLGDPESEVVRQRGFEEGIGPDLAARIRITQRRLETLEGVPGVEIRRHSTVLYNSIYRFDSQMLANAHLFGAPASQNPVLHLCRVPGGRTFDQYMGSFDRVWHAAEPLELPV